MQLTLDSNFEGYSSQDYIIFTGKVEEYGLIRIKKMIEIGLNHSRVIPHRRSLRSLRCCN